MKSSFVETIRVNNGQFCHLAYHECRARATSLAVFGCRLEWDVAGMTVPDEARQGVVKCRVVYDTVIRDVTFSPYTFRRIGSLRLIEDNAIDYRFKSTDRVALEHVFAQRDGCDNVLVVRQGMITDTSFSNIVLEDTTGLYTPDTFLLNGTRRQRLLDEGVVRERAVPVSELYRYDRLYLINAMIGLEDNISLPLSAVRF
ncbi:aminotransferase class IV [Butyricimonas sp.]|uniref:aminotransferase class IV n=1 Tax=Butyricimonas sp. TaxID=1969738 RepID=UPI0025BB2DB2|nr:aminotransferase class IV [Butyricimonas sp.]